MNAMRVIGMGSREMEAIFQVVSAILHLGRIAFSPQSVGNADG